MNASNFLSGIAFMAKGHEAKLAEQKRSETEDAAAKIVKLVNEAIHKTRELARGHLSVKTVETYQAHIKDKLSLHSGRELVQHAIQSNMSNKTS